METNILLESGTNELELMEFLVGDKHFGINVSKIMQIMQLCDITRVPDSPDEVEGVFILRGQLISVIDLYKVTGIEHTPSSKDIFVICEFNQMRVAFHVSKVCGIHRISWSDITVPDRDSEDILTSLSTGVTSCDGTEILILDFERIVAKINRTVGLDISGTENILLEGDKMCGKHILVADDSQFLNQLITSSLTRIGFTNITSFNDGEEVWDYVSAQGEQSDIACIISDIEMPRMDGHRLTKLLKSDEKFKNIPVVLFSSLINEQMIEKGKAVGADAQFSKPQISDLIAFLIGILSK